MPSNSYNAGLTVCTVRVERGQIVEVTKTLNLFTVLKEILDGFMFGGSQRCLQTLHRRLVITVGICDGLSATLWMFLSPVFAFHGQQPTV